MQPLAAIPLACSIVTFVLGMLCLFAGHKPGFMEDYHIVTVSPLSPLSLQDYRKLTLPSQLNTSDVGANLIPTSTSDIIPSSASSAISGVISGLSGLIPRAPEPLPEPGLGDDIENALGALTDDVTDAITRELGIKQWYSLHLMDMCEGDYKPNATAKGAAKNVSRCSNQTAMCEYSSSLPYFLVLV